MVKRKSKVRGSEMVEMAYLMPVVMITWMFVVFILFYYHDKNILNGAAYETAVAASEVWHEKQALPEGQMEQYFQDRIAKKMLYFGSASAEISSGEKEITVAASASTWRMSISASKKQAITEPEKLVRMKRAGKTFLEGMKDED